MLALLLCSTIEVMSWPYSGGLANCCTPCLRHAMYMLFTCGANVTEDCCRGKVPLQTYKQLMMCVSPSKRRRMVCLCSELTADVELVRVQLLEIQLSV